VTSVVAAAIVGLVIGPWLRAAIVRNLRPKDDPARGRCPRCSRTVLSSGHLAIVAPVAVLGRCPGCRARLAPPVAVIEVAAAGLLSLLVLRVHPPLVLAAAGCATAAGIILATVDTNSGRLPDHVLVPTLVTVLVLLVIAGFVDHQLSQLIDALVGAAAAFTGYTLLALATAGLGFGDCKLAALLGLMLGWFGWAALLASVTVGFLLAAIYVLPRMITGRLSRSDRIALGPFMLLGAFAVLLVVA
jgi:leader peptidase (prepilin peptidase)/N-methyltransferase